MGYESFDELTIKEAKEKLSRLEKEYYRNRQDLKDIKFSDIPEEKKEEQRFPLEEEQLLKGFEIDAENAKRAIANINVESKKKLFGRKPNTKEQQKRYEHNFNAQKAISDISLNPLLTGDYSTVLKDTQSVRVLQTYVRLLINSDEYKKNPNPEITEVIKVVEQVIREYEKVIGKIKESFDANLNIAKIAINPADTARLQDYDAYYKDAKKVASKNKVNPLDASETQRKAEEARKGIKKANVLLQALENVPKGSNIDVDLLKANLSNMELLDVMRDMEIMLHEIEQTLPQSKQYGNIQLDFSGVIEASKNAQKILNGKKVQKENKLNENGFQKEFEKLSGLELEKKVINLMAIEYEKLEKLAKGSLIKEIENNIENILISSGISDTEWERLKKEAKMTAGYNFEGKKVDEHNKFHTMRNKQERETSIANRDLVSQEEFDRIKSEAIAAANSRFKENNVMGNNDVYDLNQDERQAFIDHYIDDKINKLAALKYDETKRNENIDDKIRSENIDNIAKENLTEEQMEVAAEFLHGGGQISSIDLANLKPEEMRDVIAFTIKLRSFAGMSIDEVATELAKEPQMDVNGRLVQKETINKFDILTQKNIIERHNLMYKLDNTFRIEEGMELKR